MYRILIVKSQRDNYASLYQYLTTTDEDGNVVPVECETTEELDALVESMLNNDGYAKSDFIVVKQIDYTIDAKDYSDQADANTEAGE